MASYSYGVWQGGLAMLNPFFDTYYTDLLLGTHVGNDMHVTLASYNSYGAAYDFDSSFFDMTYNLSTCESYVQSYMTTYGITYAATYYRNIACNVVAIEWV